MVREIDLSRFGSFGELNDVEKQDVCVQCTKSSSDRLCCWHSLGSISSGIGSLEHQDTMPEHLVSDDIRYDSQVIDG